MDDYFLHTRRGVNHMRFNAEAIELAGHATDLFTEWAIDYLEQTGGSRPALLSSCSPTMPPMRRPNRRHSSWSGWPSGAGD